MYTTKSAYNLDVSAMKNGLVSGTKVRSPKAKSAIALGLFSGVFSLAVNAAELNSLSWVKDVSGPVVDVAMEGQPDYSTSILDDGRRIRVTFMETSLGLHAADIAAKGIVKGVFPYIAADDNAVHVDILLDTAGELHVVPTPEGYRLSAKRSVTADAESADDQQVVLDQAKKEIDTAESRLLGNEADTDVEIKSSAMQALTAAAAVKAASQTTPVPAVSTGADSADSDVSIVDAKPPVISKKDATLTSNADAKYPVSVEVVEGTKASTANGTQRSIITDTATEAVAETVQAAEDVQEVAVQAGADKVADAVDVTATANTNTSADNAAPNIATAGVATATVGTGVKPAQTSVPSEIPLDTLVIEGIQYSPMPGGRVQLDLKMSGRPGDPGSFSTTKPARLALDFFNTKVALQDRSVEINSGALESVAAIQTDDRTRLVLNLVRPVAYETEIRDDGITIILDSPTGAAVSAGAQQVAQFAEQAQREAKHSITRIDFRRDSSGGGKVVIDLSDPKVGVDVREEAGEIVVDFIGTSLPEELERRLDVVDFATPVQTIDAFTQGDHTRLIITPLGRFRQLAYQTGNVFTIAVNAVTAEEIEAEKADEFGYTGEKLSLNFQKISVRAALQVIADFTGLNFVTSDSVKGSLTLRLQDVPWDQALDIILQTKGLDKRQKGNVVWVAPAEEIAAKERQALEAEQKVAELEPLVSELIQINYAKAKSIADLLKSIKSISPQVGNSGAFSSVRLESVETDSNTLLSPRGQVTIDERTNTLLVQDTPKKIKEIRKLIAKLDVPVRQVLVETRIVEATDDFSKVLGARLGLARVTENARFPGTSNSNIGNVTVSGNLEDVVSINDVDDDGEGGEHVVPDGLGVDLPAIGLGNERASSIGAIISKIGAGYVHLIDLELSALQQEGSGKIIANPKVMTANQQEATIKQGQEQFFAPIGFNTKPSRDEAVLMLTVTPQITPDDRLVLDVLIKQDRFVAAGLKNKKEIKTQVLLENGETVVIGGIYQESLEDTVTKTPILGDIPLLGNLFKKRSKRDDRTELLVFLTPRILDSALSLR